MQGIYLKGYKRPKSKREIKEAVASGVGVIIEATSMHGNEFDGHTDEMPDSKITFVGPDPYTSRKFYGTITKKDGKLTVS